MSDFRLRWEWLRGPSSVTSHRETWARMGVGLDEHIWATRVWDMEARDKRDAVYGPVMPLAEWIVSNWFFLMYESYPGHLLDSGRRAHRSQHAWYARHNLLWAREGFALPDLSLSPIDSHSHIAVAQRDPNDDSSRYPVRFLAESTVLVDTSLLRREIGRLMEEIVHRLEYVDDDDARWVRERWRSLSGMDPRTEERWRTAALNGHDLEEDGDQLEWLDSALELPEELRRDVCSGAAAESLGADIDAVREVWSGDEEDWAVPSALRDARVTAMKNAASAHSVGWALAAAARDVLFETGEDLHGPSLDRRLVEVLEARKAQPLEDTNVRALVSTRSGGLHALIQPASATTSRFLRARALGIALMGGRTRAITNARVWAQAASRAFATELVAPRALVAEAIGAGVTDSEQIERIARRIGAPPMSVRHQIENHELAVVE